MSIKGMARSGSEGNTRLQKMYGAGSTPPRQDYPKGYATGGAVKAYATGGEVSDTAEGMPSKPNLGRPGRKMGKGKAKAGGKGTNVNVVIMPKPDMPKPDMAAGAPPAGPGPMPMPPPGAGGPPMPMRAKGGRVSGQDTHAERESMKSMGRKSGGKVMKHDDAAEDRKMIKSMVKPSALTGKKEGGPVLKMHAGAGSGVGRIEKEKKQKRA